MVGVHLWSLATSLAYFISCLKEGRKGPKIPITRGRLSEEHTIFFKDQLPEIPEDRDKDILSYVAHVPSKHLKRDNSECQEGMKWTHSHPGSLVVPLVHSIYLYYWNQKSSILH